jgi:hypothetical protein
VDSPIGVVFREENSNDSRVTIAILIKNLWHAVIFINSSFIYEEFLGG